MIEFEDFLFICGRVFCTKKKVHLIDNNISIGKSQGYLVDVNIYNSDRFEFLLKIFMGKNTRTKELIIRCVPRKNYEKWCKIHSSFNRIRKIINYSAMI
jgi:hypothetical protein